MVLVKLDEDDDDGMMVMTVMMVVIMKMILAVSDTDVDSCINLQYEHDYFMVMLRGRFVL